MARTRIIATAAGGVAWLALALVTGCAEPGTGALDRPTGPPQTGALPSATPPPSSGTPYASGPAAPGDRPPNAADNNAWKQRRELSAADRQAGAVAAARIRPALERLRAAGSFAPEATQRVLLSLGYPATDILVTPMQPAMLGTTTQAPPGAVYALRIGQAGCVIGDVRPDRVLVEVTGAAAEFGCLEPSSH
jgi:hypothetical protein